MWTLFDRFRNATITGFKDQALYLAFLAAKSNREIQKCNLIARSLMTHITTPTGSIPNAYNRYLCIPDLQRWSFPLLSEMNKFLLQTTIRVY